MDFTMNVSGFPGHKKTVYPSKYNKLLSLAVTVRLLTTIRGSGDKF